MCHIYIPSVISSLHHSQHFTFIFDSWWRVNRVTVRSPPHWPPTFHQSFLILESKAWHPKFSILTHTDHLSALLVTKRKERRETFSAARLQLKTHFLVLKFRNMAAAHQVTNQGEIKNPSEQKWVGTVIDRVTFTLTLQDCSLFI